MIYQPRLWSPPYWPEHPDCCLVLDAHYGNAASFAPDGYLPPSHLLFQDSVTSIDTRELISMTASATIEPWSLPRTPPTKLL